MEDSTTTSATSEGSVLNSPEPPTSYEIGDRVIIQGLEKSPHINGLHATIVTEPKSNSDGVIRYGVDFDLVLPNVQRCAIKVQNLRLEPPLRNVERAQVKEGALVESEGRAINFALDIARFGAAQSVHGWEDIKTIDDIYLLRETNQGILRQNMCMSSAWTFWNDGSTILNEGGIYATLKDYIQNTLVNDGPFHGDLDKISAEVGYDYKRLYDAVDDVRAIKGWNVRITGEFWVVDMDDDGTYLVSDIHRSAVYQCVGVKDAIWPKLQGKVVCMRVTMIPWYGRLVYDGVLMQSQDKRPSEFIASPSLVRTLRESVNLAKKERRVISRLVQLEVEGGSLKGTHDMIPGKASNSTTSTPIEQPPASSKELKLVKQLKKLPVDSEPPKGNVPSHWVFRRFGYQKRDNPNNMIVVLANSGMNLGMFCTKKLRPKAHEILEQVLDLGKRTGMLPFAVMIDDKECLERAKFLCSDFKNLHLEYYAPPTEEETSAAFYMGPT